jgi:hypothetical protein
MSTKSRTIDNLGTEASVRYAKDKQLFEPQLIEESKWIPQKTAISVLKPYEMSEFDQIFSSFKKIIWAAFSPPPDYYTETKPLFSYQVIPSLGDLEKQETDTNKLEELKDALEQKKKKKQELLNQENEEDDDDDEKNRKALLSLLQCIHQLDKTLSFINARRNQYHRG